MPLNALRCFSFCGKWSRSLDTSPGEAVKEMAPDTISIMEGRTAFGAVSKAYNDARPPYPQRVFDILRDVGALPQGARVFEIGAGTGQATEPLLAMGSTVSAVEPNERLSSILADRLKNYGSLLNVVKTSFEDSDLLAGAFDLGVAATAFHWLKAEPTLATVFRLLRPGGWWAMWWTVFGDPDDMDPFQRRTQSLFERLSRSPSNDGKRPFALDREARKAELETAGFLKVGYEEIRWKNRLTTRQVQLLTQTFSSVARLSQDERSNFLSEIGRIVDDEFGGHVRRNFVTAVYVGQKPPT
ncbi:class I SAM-dependent methyltransferase [Mesorhizobium sp. 1B3]|uniref:class I SAM-dependent methyltransferase n=1 Tax=Mesorhizobium sp. 1B3 TaxID=3243599 RepID=UPI003D988C0D